MTSLLVVVMTGLDVRLGMPTGRQLWLSPEQQTLCTSTKRQEAWCGNFVQPHNIAQDALLSSTPSRPSPSDSCRR